MNNIKGGNIMAREFMIVQDKGVIAYKLKFRYVNPSLTKIHILVHVKHDTTNDHFTLKGPDYNLYFKSAYQNKGKIIPAGTYQLFGKVSINTMDYHTKGLDHFKQVRLDVSSKSDNLTCRILVKPKVYVSREIHDKMFLEARKHSIHNMVRGERNDSGKYTPYKKTNVKKPFQGGSCTPK